MSLYRWRFGALETVCRKLTKKESTPTMQAAKAAGGGDGNGAKKDQKKKDPYTPFIK